MPTPESYLRGRGLEPLGWDEALRRIEARLGPSESETFARLHRAFVAYPAGHTARAFYDFVARRDLHDLLACRRFDRLRALAAALEDAVPRGARVLDFGAGGGFLAEWLRKERGAAVSVADLSPAAVNALAARGFPAPRAGEVFDVVLCADSLGEIHADEDDWLSDPENSGDDGYDGELEARYGFAHKLAALKSLLAHGEGKRGAVLLFEPIALEHFWRGAARLLEAEGWWAELRGPDPVWGLKLSTR